MTKKMKISFLDLMKKNKEEILKDEKVLEKIEKKIDEKYINSK